MKTALHFVVYIFFPMKHEIIRLNMQVIRFGYVNVHGRSFKCLRGDLTSALMNLSVMAESL